jgi:hypothetical protein
VQGVVVVQKTCSPNSKPKNSSLDESKSAKKCLIAYRGLAPLLPSNPTEFDIKHASTTTTTPREFRWFNS